MDILDNTNDMAANADGAINNAADSEGLATPTKTADEADNSPADTGEETNNPVENPTEPHAEPPITETQAFARRLAEKTAEIERATYEKVNAIIAKLGGVTPDGEPIRTFEDLQRTIEYQEMQEEAARQNVPVEVLSRLTQAERDALEAKTMLSEYQRKEAIAKEAEQLANDPKWGKFYKAHEADIKAVAEQFKCDLGTAKLIVYDKIGPETIDEAEIGNRYIQDYIAGKYKDYRPVEGIGATPVQVPQTPKTFAEARAGSLALLRAMRETS